MKKAGEEKRAGREKEKKGGNDKQRWGGLTGGERAVNLVGRQNQKKGKNKRPK